MRPARLLRRVVSKMTERTHLHGLLAEFENAEALLCAVASARQEGWQHLDAYTPYPVEGLAEALGDTTNHLPLLTLLAGVAGGATTFVFESWTTLQAYPQTISARPAFAWPAFLVPAFEMTIFCAALAAVIGMLVLNGLPAFYHPVFHAENFCAGASTDKFFLCLEARDRHFERKATYAYLESLQPISIVEVER